MFGIENLALFVGTGILLNLYPGPDTIYIIGRSLSQGRAAGVAAALGIGTGSIVHTLLGACGLSAIITASATAFLVLKYAGCAYLLYQGIQLLRGTATPPVTATRWLRGDLLQIYRQGAVTNILNPKVAIFFLAFLPQFISLSSPNKPLSFLILGGLFITTGTIWCLVVALFSAALSSRLRRSSGASLWLRRINGLLFLGLGIKLATAQLER